MLQAVNDYRVLGVQSGVKTSLPKSFVGLLMMALRVEGHTLVSITSQGGRHIIETDKTSIFMEGSFSVNDVKAKLWEQ